MVKVALNYEYHGGMLDSEHFSETTGQYIVYEKHVGMVLDGDIFRPFALNLDKCYSGLVLHEVWMRLLFLYSRRVFLLMVQL